MHLGLLGPKRVRLEDDGMAVAPPYELVDNPFASSTSRTSSSSIR
jgi:hypothetical protein